jgi:hypothetical protein
MALSRSIRPVLLLMAAALLLSGCAAPRVHLGITGYANPKYTSGPAGGSLFILKNKNPANVLLDQEVARKLEKIMAKQGYEIVGRETAGFIMTYSFGLESGPNVTRYTPYYEPGETYSRFRGYDKHGRPIYETYRLPGYTHYEPYQEQTHRRWLKVRVVDAKLMRQEDKKEVIWAGDAESFGSSRDLRSVLNYLIAGVMKQLWVDTGRALEFYLPQDDPGVAEIGRY